MKLVFRAVWNGSRRRRAARGRDLFVADEQDEVWLGQSGDARALALFEALLRA